MIRTLRPLPLIVLCLAAGSLSASQAPTFVAAGPAPTCRTANRIDLSVDEVRALAEMVRKGSVTDGEASRRISTCGVHFPLQPSRLEPWWKELPLNMAAVLGDAVSRYEKLEQTAYDVAENRRMADAWDTYAATFSDASRATFARSEAAKSMRFEWLTQRPVIKAALSGGFNQLDLSLLHLWRDGDLIRAFLRVYVRQSGEFAYQKLQSEVRSTLGFDETGRPLRQVHVYLLNRAGEAADRTLAAAAGDTFYVDLHLAGAAVDARAVTLLALPFMRQMSSYSSWDGDRMKYMTPAGWKLPIADGRPSVSVPPAPIEISSLVRAGAIDEWKCPGRCPSVAATYLVDPHANTIVQRPIPFETALESLVVKFYGATRTADSPTNGLTTLVYGITNGRAESQFLQPSQGIERLLIRGSDDRQRPVVLRWYGVFDAKFRRTDAIWLEPGETAYALMALTNLHEQASTVTLQGRFLLNRTDEMRFRLPAR